MAESPPPLVIRVITALWLGFYGQTRRINYHGIASWVWGAR